MKINKVTITGADDSMNPQNLYDISKQYPSMEYGILFSRTKIGDKRYPTKEWVNNLLFLSKYNSSKLNLSAHLCGEYSRELLNNRDFDFNELISNFHSEFSRIQINNNFKNSNFTNWNEIFKYNYNRKIIFQYNKSTKDIIDSNLSLIKNNNVQFLYDSSGGRGIKIERIENPIKNFYTGYAGGINVDNISEICQLIKNHKDKSNVWIDIESGVRTNDEFDIDKVKYILNKVYENTLP